MDNLWTNINDHIPMYMNIICKEYNLVCVKISPLKTAMIGDEFAIIMVEMTSDLKYTIEEKIKAVNEELGTENENIPAVSLSVGVAFSDRENSGESIFKDADKALYYVKENGRNGCKFY